MHGNRKLGAPDQVEPMPLLGPEASDELFQTLIASGRVARRSGLSVCTSLIVHLGVVAALVLIPVLWPGRFPD